MRYNQCHAVPCEVDAVLDSAPNTGLDLSLDMSFFRWAQPSAILVATDLSELDRLMPLAIEHAAETGARLILLHVLAPAAAMPAEASGMPYYDPVGALEFAAKTLEPWCILARRQNIVCDAMVREGDPARQIEAAVRQFQADRILLGTRSRSKLGKLLLGSVAEQVRRSVNIPVMTVGAEAHLLVEEGERTVLCATALRETSGPSAALACRIAASHGAKLILLHVLPPMDEMERKGLPTGLDSAALHELRMLAGQAAAGSPIAVETRVVHGNPFIEILAEASERHAGLIVLGATGHSTFENLTRDRTVYRVLTHACCPVLTLRELVAAVDGGEAASLAIHL
jgi:nucleotide-binding universal stress UspA family protein